MKEEILLASNRIMQKEADAKSTFIRHVFHEMRTPLHVLSTFLSSSNPSDEDFEEMRHHTGTVHGMALHCLALWLFNWQSISSDGHSPYLSY